MSKLCIVASLVYTYVCMYVWMDYTGRLLIRRHYLLRIYIHTFMVHISLILCVAPQIASPYLTLAMAYEEIGDMDKHYQVSAICRINTQ